MSIKVSQPHSFTVAEAKTKLGSFEEMLGKYGVKLAWKGDRADIKGIGVSGGVAVTDSEVEVTVKLGMMAKAAGVNEGKLTKSIEKRLRNALTDSDE